MLGLLKFQQDRLQSVHNVAARLKYGFNRYDRITDLLRDRLQWLLFPQRIAFKCWLLVYNSPHELSLAAVLKSQLFNVDLGCT